MKETLGAMVMDDLNGKSLSHFGSGWVFRGAALGTRCLQSRIIEIIWKRARRKSRKHMK